MRMPSLLPGVQLKITVAKWAVQLKAWTEQYAAEDGAVSIEDVLTSEDTFLQCLTHLVEGRHLCLARLPGSIVIVRT